MSAKIEQNRKDIQQLKNEIEEAQYNAEFANEVIEATLDAATRNELEERNERRLASISAMVADLNRQMKE